MNSPDLNPYAPLTIRTPIGPIDCLAVLPPSPSGRIVFAAGRGGDPRRYAGLLSAMARQGFAVLAPILPISAATPSPAELDHRRVVLNAAIDHISDGMPVTGVGHSLGAAALLLCAGATGRTIDGSIVRQAAHHQLSRLTLLGPALDFFQSEDAFLGVAAKVHAWVGDLDPITSAATALEMVEDQRSAVMQVTVVPGAGHFAFMDQPPPGVTEASFDRAALAAMIAGSLAHE